MCNSSSSNARHAFNYEHGDCDTRAATASIARHVCGHSEQSARREKQSKRTKTWARQMRMIHYGLRGTFNSVSRLSNVGNIFFFSLIDLKVKSPQ